MSKIQPTILETINLPSRGIIYGGKIPESFNIRPMTVSELKMLYGSKNILQALNSIIKSVVDVEDFPVDDLISADRLYLAYFIRAITFTEEYKVKPYCSYCKENVDVSINLLNDIKIDYLENGFQNPRSIGKLPKSGDVVELRLLTSSDFNRIVNRVEEIKKTYPDYDGDPLYPITLGAQIASINGKQLGSRELEEYVLDMHAVDDLYISKKVEEVKVGPVLPVEIKCPKCGNTLFVNIRMAEDFFRPELDFT